jgi:thiopeptide-type bacteriocin biosynthesis protein
VLRPLQSRIDEDAAGTRIWRLQVDTYDPEAERYGGAAGLDLAERLFHVDSVAVVRMLESTPAAERARQRWRLALLGTDMLLDDVGLCLRQKMEVIARQRRSLWAQLDCERGLEQQLSKRYRRERASLEELVFDQPRRLEGAEDHLEARSRGFRQLASELPTLVRAGRVLSTVEDVSASYIHMFANRILDVGQNAQELVICDFLARLYASHAARAGIAGLSKIR